MKPSDFTILIELGELNTCIMSNGSPTTIDQWTNYILSRLPVPKIIEGSITYEFASYCVNLFHSRLNIELRKDIDGQDPR